MMKKRFVAPRLTAEATLVELTLVLQVSGGGGGDGGDEQPI
jgi:hypothetical protein